MNSDEARDLLADYLGGELSESQRRQFEAYLAGDPGLAAKVEGLRRALAAMRSLDEPAAAAKGHDTRASAPADNHAAWRHKWTSALMRYAAIIVLAFGAGYLTNNVTTGPNESGLPAIVRPVQNEAPRDWETRVAVAYAKQPGRSGLARSLVALTHATREP